MQALNFVFILIGVLALFGAAAWLFQRFAGNRLGANTNRGRMPRLAVIDAAAVDGRRRLVLVRRDNVEHLLMIGGPTDIVVEPSIVRATPARDQMAPRPVGGAEPPPRIAPLPDSNWSDDSRSDSFDHPEPQMPEPPPRPVRPSFADEVRRPAAPPLPERRSDPLLAGFSPESIAARSEPRNEPRNEPRPEPRVELRNEPPLPPARPQRSEPMMPRAIRQEPPKAPPPIRAERPVAVPPPPPVPPPAPAPAPSLSSADQNLAEMAQRLEAALRRPPETTEPRVGAPPVAPEPPPSRPAPRVVEPPAAASSPKTGFENLEDEMASLLGRPKSPS